MHKEKALKIYLFVNCLSIGFMIFLVLWILKLPQLNVFTHKSYWVVVLPYVLIVNIVSGYAKKFGKGLANPIRTNKKAVLFKYLSFAFFFGGLMIGILVNAAFMYLALLGVPFEIAKVYVAHRDSGFKEDIGLIDDFEIE